MFTMLNLGDSHTGKTQSLSTLPERSILFNFEPPDNVTSLRVPYREELRLMEFWKKKEPIEKVLVIQYTGVPREVSLLALPDPNKTKITAFIEDLNTIGKHLDEVDNLILETLAPFGDEVLDFVVASALQFARAPFFPCFRPSMRISFSKIQMNSLALFMVLSKNTQDIKPFRFHRGSLFQKEQRITNEEERNHVERKRKVCSCHRI